MYFKLPIQPDLVFHNTFVPYVEYVLLWNASWHPFLKYVAFILVLFQNNNLERALDWIFTHPEEEESDALSDMADTEPNDNAFSNANSHSDSTLSPDHDASGPRIKDGPGRKWLGMTPMSTAKEACSFFKVYSWKMYALCKWQCTIYRHWFLPIFPFCQMFGYLRHGIAYCIHCIYREIIRHDKHIMKATDNLKGALNA